MKKYGKILKEERKIRKLTQTEISKAIGISQQVISFYENDKAEPTIGIIERLADLYGITIDELIRHEIKKNW